MAAIQDPVLNFLTDGGSWADAAEMEATLKIPVLEAQLQAAVRKGPNPSAERHRQRLLADLRQAYSDTYRPASRADALLAAAQEEWAKEKGQSKEKKAAPSTPSKPAKTPEAPGAPVKPKRPSNWAALMDSDSDDE